MSCVFVDPMNILAIDYGSTIGLAIYYNEHKICSIIKEIYEKDIRKATNKINDIIIKKNIDKVIIGWPVLMNYDEAQQCKNTQKFIDMLSRVWGGNIIKQDERFTSSIASTLYNTNSDSVAAMILLERYINSQS